MNLMLKVKDFGNVNWENALQSVKDFWVPTLIGVVCIGLLIFGYNKLVKKRK
ncbi:hypothetical protein [Suicoccus acidiformans]|uniref:hypothetical protein n=1 Tax=Suicoccus acidiformans TaxID=2036206 RepID=UPI0013C32E0B|nr:hypothetical protein [Suicoccus acidiformans]